MYGVTIAKNLTRVGIVTGAAYFSFQEGVWSTSDESVGPMEKVKQQLLPNTFHFFEELPHKAADSWNHGVSSAFDKLKHCECSTCRVKKYFESLRPWGST